MKRVAVFALLLALPGLHAQDSADFDIEGVTYYFAAGSHASGHLAWNNTLDGTQEPFEGCVHMTLDDRPERNDVGMVRVIGLYDGHFMEFDLYAFEETAPGMDGGLAQDLLIDGSRMTPGEKQHPTVFAGIAGWGFGGLRIGPVDYADPVTGSQQFKASMFVTPNGFRDNETGAVINEAGGPWQPGDVPVLGQNDWEAHLRIQSPPGTRQADANTLIARPGPAATDLFTPSEAYSDVFLFDNNRFGGTMTVTFDFETIDPIGENMLRVVLRDPSGQTLDDVELVPALNAPVRHEVNVPLSQFGKYSLDVSGPVSLSRYDLSVTQHTPSDFDMSLWWDDVTFGRASTPTLHDCEDTVGRPEDLVATVVEQEFPPAFQWVPIGFGIATAMVGIVVVGKLIHMSASRQD